MNWHQACGLPYYHGSDLGANPTAEETTFKLWAPTACGVVVCLYATGTDAEPGAKELGVHEMRRGDGGVWAIVLPGTSASASTCSSMRAPRAVLIKMTPSFILARVS